MNAQKNYRRFLRPAGFTLTTLLVVGLLARPYAASSVLVTVGYNGTLLAVTIGSAVAIWRFRVAGLVVAVFLGWAVLNAANYCVPNMAPEELDTHGWFRFAWEIIGPGLMLLYCLPILTLRRFTDSIGSLRARASASFGPSADTHSGFPAFSYGEPGCFFGAAMFAMIALPLMVGASLVFWESEGASIRRDLTAAKNWRAYKRRAEIDHNAKKRLQSLGGIVGDWCENFDGFEGTYVDLSSWHGSKCDFACLSDLQYFGNDRFYISLKGLNFGDDDLVHLEVLRDLDYVDLTDTKVTDAGIARLRRAVPNVTVIRDAATLDRLVASPATSWLGQRPWDADIPYR
jgi:hypothetical protein